MNRNERSKKEGHEYKSYKSHGCRLRVMNNECNENGRVSLAASLGDEDLCGGEGLNGCFI